MKNNFQLKRTNDIPSSKGKFLIFKKSPHWNYSLDIILESLELDIYGLKNLAISIYSLITIDKLHAYEIATVTSSKIDDKTTIVIDSVKVKWVVSIEHFEFIEWLRFRLVNDEKYFDESEHYSFRITYEKFFVLKCEKDWIKTPLLEWLKPDYPWNEKVERFWVGKFASDFISELNKVKKEVERLTESEKKIIEENKILKKEILELRNQVEDKLVLYVRGELTNHTPIDKY